MKKLVVLFVLSIPALGLSTTLSEQLERVTAQVLSASSVQVRVKLAKPVYMSDVMFRRPRCKNVVIGFDYKQVQCRGYLSAQGTQVYVPLSCVSDKNYKAAEVSVIFPDGKKISKSGTHVQYQSKIALIRI